jgi:hypothetical protein
MTNEIREDMLGVTATALYNAITPVSKGTVKRLAGVSADVPVIDSSGRVLRLVNIVDLLAVLLVVAVVSAGSALVLPRAVAGPVAAAVGAVSLVGLVAVSKWQFGVSWSEVGATIRDAWPSMPSRPFIGGFWRWVTAEPEPEVIVIDLRETVTVGPVIYVLGRVIARFVRMYRVSGLQRVVGQMVGMVRTITEWTGLNRIARAVSRALGSPEPPERE